MNKAAHTVIYSLLACMILTLAVFAFWTFESRTVLVVTNNPVPVRPDTINPEAAVILSPRFCKYMQKPAHVERFLISNVSKIQLPAYPNNLPVGCRTYDVPVIIPGNTPDGIYHLEYTVTYTINPITNSIVRWHSEDFTVKHVPPLPVTGTLVQPIDPVNTETIPKPTAATNQSASVLTKQDTAKKSILDSIGDTLSNILKGLKS